MDPGTPSQLKKIAVTGSNGRVGRRVVLTALQKGYHVVGIDHSPLATDDRDLGSNFSFLQADLKNYDEALKALEGCEAVVHLAGYPNPGDYKVNTHNSNVVLSYNILRAAAELGIKRVAQASSVNVVTMVYSHATHFESFPIDESHPCLPDEPYGLSKLIGEVQADSIVRRYPDMRIASLRLHWNVPSRAFAADVANGRDPVRAKNDLWGYVHENSTADAFMLAITHPTNNWPSAAEAFFIVAPETTAENNTLDLLEEHWPKVPIKEGKDISGHAGLFDCSKAERLLGWVHNDDLIVQA